VATVTSARVGHFQCFFGNERPKPNVNHYAKTLEQKIKKEDRRSERNDKSISTNTNASRPRRDWTSQVVPSESVGVCRLR